MADTHTIVVVDRHRLGMVHDYCVHGYTHCTRCRHVVALGDKTLDYVQGGAKPVCLTCATELAQQGDLSPSQRVFNLKDHR